MIYGEGVRSHASIMDALLSILHLDNIIVSPGPHECDCPSEEIGSSVLIVPPIGAKSLTFILSKRCSTQSTPCES